MTRARILADYVAGGTTAAEFDYMDGVTSNVQTQMDTKAPITNAALVTPNLGTPSAGVLTNATFPSGHVVNTTLKGCTATLQLNQADEIFVSASDGIENLAVTAGNKLAIWFIGGNVYSSTNSPYYCGLQIRVNDNSSDTDYQSTISGHVGSDARFDPAVAFAFHTCVGTSIDIMYGLWGYTNNASTHYYLAAQHYTAGQADGLRLCVQEIQA